MDETRAVRVCISGLVQGVNYRAWTRRRATELGLSGWVRNVANGDVEAVFSGPAHAVDTMLLACREGPRHARVDAVEVVGETEQVNGPFAIRR
jgi:acylphosphatase